MATALIDPVIESEEISEDQLLLGEENNTRHASIINSNYKEMKTIKNKEEKGEKQKE